MKPTVYDVIDHLKHAIVQNIYQKKNRLLAPRNFGILEFWNFGIILPSLLALKHPNKQHHHHHPLLQYLSTTATAAQEQHDFTFNSKFESRHYCVQQTPLYHLTAHCCNGETAFESTRR